MAHPPLTPPECDLRDFPRMMLDITRLRQSDFDATPDDSAWRAGLNLWFSAWHSVPAGSLSDDEAALAKAAGLGRDLRTWRKVKAAAMRGFVLCDDGRHYHETVCEFALEAWLEKLSQRLSSGAGNAKRWKISFDPADIEHAVEHAAALLARISPQSKALLKIKRRQSRQEDDGNPNGTENQSRRDAENVPPGSQGTGTGTGTGNIEEEDANASLSPGDDKPRRYPDDFEEAWRAYPHVQGRSSKPKALTAWRKITAGRRSLMAAAARRYALEGREPKAECGAPGMHRWLNEERYLDFLAPSAAAVQPVAWNGPPDLLADLCREMGEDHANGVLRMCRWDQDRGAIVTSSGTVADLIRKGGPRALRAHQAQVLEERAA